jgi:4-diphosphocytidyl-2-C-methyl-D-erythritol kinase
MKKLAIKSNAKINLSLEIINKREDGYHNINTIFAPISLYDDITIEENSSGLKFEIFPKTEFPIYKNLLFRGAKLFFEHYKTEYNNLSITLNKRIPIGAGLGGGSSNAAYIINALNEYCGINAPKKDLMLLCRQLGADVPFFINHSCAIGKGIGDDLEYIDVKIPYHVLIVHPNVFVSTSWAYQSLNLIGRNKENDLKELLIKSVNDKQIFSEYFRNDFENLVFKKYPEINFVKKKMNEHGAFFSMMTGSGSTVFGLFDDEEVFEKAYDYFFSYFEDYLTFKCDFL